jgi:hypothetical protein
MTALLIVISASCFVGMWLAILVALNLSGKLEREERVNRLLVDMRLAGVLEPPPKPRSRVGGHLRAVPREDDDAG